MIFSWKYNYILVLLVTNFYLFCITVEENKITETPQASPGKTSSQIEEKIDSLLSVHIQESDKDYYPQYFGIDSRNSLRMIIVYHCSLQCNNEPLLFLIYEDVNEQTCISEKFGEPLYSLDSGKYIGCEPSDF